MYNVKIIDVEGQTITVCADTDNIRPYKPSVFFIHAKCDIKIVFERTDERNICFEDVEWCNMMSVNLIKMVEMANELLKENEKDLF